MIKSLLLTLSLSVTAYASTNLLTAEDFQADEMFKYVVVEKAERVFSDELTQEDLYQVTYLVDGEKCASNGEIDFCEQVEVCEYIWADVALGKEKVLYDPTNIECSADIEEVLGDYLIDEL